MLFLSLLNRLNAMFLSRIRDLILLLTLSWQKSLSCRNQSIDLQRKSTGFYMIGHSIMNELNHGGPLSSHTTFSCGIKFLSIFRIISSKIFTVSFMFLFINAFCINAFFINVLCLSNMFRICITANQTSR